MRFELTDALASRTRSIAGTDVGTHHEITLWGLRPDRAYAWSAFADNNLIAEGTMQTAELPAGVAGIAFDVTGNDPVVEHHMFTFRCDAQYLLIVAADGDVVWYQEVVSPSGGRGNVSGFNTTADNSVVILVGGDILEYDMSGREVNRILRGTHFDEPLHHDVYKHGGFIYALNHSSYALGGTEAVVDGFYVFDEGGQQVAQWELNDHVSYSASELRGTSRDFPGASEWSHGNSIFVDDSGVYMSTRHLSTVWKIRSYTDENFGAIEWKLTGDPESSVTDDFVLSGATGVTDQADFLQQHHATIAADGILTIFDNRTRPDASRALAIEFDPANGTATIVASHAVPVQCNIQGGAFRLPNGDMIATCAVEGKAYHYRRNGGDAPSFTFAPRCTIPGGSDDSAPVPLARIAPFVF